MTSAAYLAAVEARAGANQEPCTVCPDEVIQCSHLGEDIVYINRLGHVHGPCRWRLVESRYEKALDETRLCLCADPETVEEARAEFDRRTKALRCE